MPPSVVPPGQQAVTKMKISEGMYRGDGPSTTLEPTGGTQSGNESPSVGSSAASRSVFITRILKTSPVFLLLAFLEAFK